MADDHQLLSRILVESLPPLPPYEIGRKVDLARPGDQKSEESDAA